MPTTTQSLELATQAAERTILRDFRAVFFAYYGDCPDCLGKVKNDGYCMRCGLDVWREMEAIDAESP